MLAKRRAEICMSFILATILVAHQPAVAQEMGVTAIVVAPKLFGTAELRTRLGVQAHSGRLTLQRGNFEVSSAIARDGGFELPFLLPGRYSATIAVRQSICTTTMDIPRISAMRTNLGMIACFNPKQYDS